MATNTRGDEQAVAPDSQSDEANGYASKGKKSSEPVEPNKFTLSPLRWPLLVGVGTFAFCNGFVS